MRVEFELTLDLLLHADGGVEGHAEVVASMMLRLVLHRRTGQVEDAPVLQRADCACAREYQVACAAGDILHVSNIARSNHCYQLVQHDEDV